VAILITLKEIFGSNLIVLFIVISSSAYAQQTDKVVYCEILGMQRFKYTIPDVVFFDFGDKTTSSEPKDYSGERLKFKSMIEALNYMVKQGWEFVQAYSSDDGYNHYLLKKKLDPIDYKGQDEIKKD
jgi:hypothetical protein